MKDFQKVNFDYLGQALIGCSKPYRLLLFDTLSQVKFKSNGFVEVSTKLIAECLKTDDKNIIYGFRSAMVKYKIWVKVKSDTFMINPLVMNSSGSDQLIQLVAVYKGYGGKLVDLKNLTGSEKNSAKLIEMEYQTAIDAITGKALREGSVRMEALEKQMIEIKEQMKLLVEILTPEQKQQAQPILSIVTRNGDLV